MLLSLPHPTSGWKIGIPWSRYLSFAISLPKHSLSITITLDSLIIRDQPLHFHTRLNETKMAAYLQWGLFQKWLAMSGPGSSLQINPHSVQTYLTRVTVCLGVCYFTFQYVSTIIVNITVVTVTSLNKGVYPCRAHICKQRKPACFCLFERGLQFWFEGPDLILNFRNVQVWYI